MRNPFKNEAFMKHVNGEVFHVANHCLIHPKEVKDMKQSDKDMLKVFDLHGAIELAHFSNYNEEMLDDIIQWHYKQWKSNRIKTVILALMMALGALIGTGAFMTIIFIKWITPVSDPMVVFYYCMIIGAIGAMLSGFGAMLFNRQ